MALSCCHVVRQMVEIDLLRRPRAQARVWPSFIVKRQVPAERSTRIAYAVIGPQVDLLGSCPVAWCSSFDLRLGRGQAATPGRLTRGTSLITARLSRLM